MTADISQDYGRGARHKVFTQSALEYQREVKTQNLKTAVKRWRRLSNHIEDTLGFVKDDQALQREKSLLVNAMPDIFEITDSLTSLFSDEVFPDVEDVERNHSELLRRISHRLSELGIETKSKSSHISKLTLNRSRLFSRASTRSSKSTG